MACRIVNLHSQPLHIDLRGGGILLLAPNERSRVLQEELLYDNQHIGTWVKAGWLRQIPARMSELHAEATAKPGKGADQKREGKQKSGLHKGGMAAKKPTQKKNHGAR